MASEQWLLNDTSVASGSYFTAVGSSYKLQNASGGTLSRTTTTPTPYEGAGCYRSSAASNSIFNVFDSSSNPITGGTYYFDTYLYTRSSPSDEAYVIQTGNTATSEFTGVFVDDAGSLGIATYDPINDFVIQSITTSGTCPDNAWFRVALKLTSGGTAEAKLFKGSNINGTTADNTVSWTPTYSSFEFIFGGGGYASNGLMAFDNIKFDNTAYPTRGGTAHTAAASATATATGTAAMSNARVGAGSSTETATGTAVASNQRALAGTSSVTASATAAMSSTQVIGASGIGTASGTAAGAITAVVTIDGVATATASGTAGASSTQVFAGSATVTATGTADSSIRPIVTVGGSGSITATGATTASKQQTLAGVASATASATAGLISITPISGASTATATATALALITTPGTLYGNATKVAGLYGSSTKPTLTTRS